MAQKRMFDKRVVASDKFIDLPNSSKALYFMAGMDADDKGFFQPKKLQKICGFSDDDYKILIAKGFFIPFESGVMVITDWNKNNWLDTRRLTETEYIEELKMLELVNDKYELNNPCLANAKPMLSQNSIEEYSIEENSIDTNMSKIKTDFRQEFEMLWKEYPKKEGKKKALDEYTKARKKGTTFEEVQKGIEEYNKHIKRKKVTSQYISMGSTWFNQHRWSDDYSNERSYLEIMREEEENEQRRSESTT